MTVASGCLQALGAEFLDEGGKTGVIWCSWCGKDCFHRYKIKCCLSWMNASFALPAMWTIPCMGEKRLQSHLWAAKRCNTGDGRRDGWLDTKDLRDRLGTFCAER